jgi:hypothetical protein
MTVAPVNPATAALSEHDRIIAAGDYEPRGTDILLPWALGIDFHLRSDTPVTVRLYPTEARVTIRLGSYPAELDLYASADRLDRLITVLTAARQRLTEAAAQGCG